jgi:hypothetical protein
MTRWASVTPTAIAVRALEAPREWNCGSLDVLIDQWRRKLLTQALQAGNHVDVSPRNRVDHQAMIVACTQRGATQVVLNP